MTTLKPKQVTVSSGCALVGVDMSHIPLPKKLQVTSNGKDYILKPETHVTLIGWGHEFVKKLSKEKDIDDSAAKDLATSYIQFALSELYLNVYIKKPEFFFVRKAYTTPSIHERRTLVVPVHLVGGRDFYRELTKLSGIEFKPVPHHITLYTLDDKVSEKGIGLITYEDFLGRTKLIKSPHVLNQLSAIT